MTSSSIFFDKEQLIIDENCFFFLSAFIEFYLKHFVAEYKTVCRSNLKLYSINFRWQLYTKARLLSAKKGYSTIIQDDIIRIMNSVFD